MSLTVEELVAPAEITADWIAAIRVRNTVIADSVGSAALAREPDELLPQWHNPHELKRMVVARIDGEIVGRGTFETDAESTAGWVSLEVLPDVRGRGIGSAIHDRLVGLAHAEGKTIMQVYATEKVSQSTDVIPSPTGFGSVPRDTAINRFLVRHGYALEQVGLRSHVMLPVDVSELQRDAAAAAGPEYSVRTFVGRTPADLLHDMALLRQSMGYDAPNAGMETEVIWTADRVREEDDALEGSPRTMLTAMVHHVPSGEVAGYTELDIPPETDRPVIQGDTIVLAGHRGRRLGMLLKVANIARLQEVAPGHPSITTSNASDNTHMLAVNDAVGFVGWASMGAWKKDL